MLDDAPSPARPRVAVIGGGVAGLVAARDLARAGIAVTVHEANDRLGGRIRQETVAGATVDIGAEGYATRGGTVAEYLTELGISHLAVAPRRLGSWVVTPSRALPLPPAGSLGIPARPLSADSRRVLGLTGALRAAVEPMLPRTVGARARSLGELVRVRLGARTLDRLVRPIVLGVYSADPAALPVARFPQLRAAFERRGSLLRASRELRGQSTAAGGAIGGLRGGMGALIDALAAELAALGVEVRLGAAVEALEPAGGGWRVRGSDTSLADAVLLATTEHAARRILGSEVPSQHEVRVEVIVLVVQDARLDSAPRGTGALVVPERAGGERAGTAQLGGERAVGAKALTHATAKWQHLAERVPPGAHVIRLSYGSEGSPPATADLDDTEATAFAVRDASRILGVPLRAADVRGMSRRVWEFGQAADGGIAGRSGAGVRDGRVDAGGPARSGESEPSGERDAAGAAAGSAPLAFAGDWVSGTGLASVIPGAREAAGELLSRLPATTERRHA